MMVEGVTSLCSTGQRTQAQMKQDHRSRACEKTQQMWEITPFLEMKSLYSKEQRAKEKIKVKDRRGEIWHWWTEQMDRVCVFQYCVQAVGHSDPKRRNHTHTFAHLTGDIPQTSVVFIHS